MRWIAAIVGLVVVALLFPQSLLDQLEVLVPGGTDVVDVQVGGPRPTRGEIRQLLDGLEVQDIEQRSGYDRECGSGHGCVFGPAWSDDTSAPWGHDGCDTRNQMLAASLKDPEFREGTDECVVVAGSLVDPFTGKRLEFRKEAAAAVAVDHVFPLALSWHQGAADWSPGRRAQFANDPVNLLVVDGPANSSKGDSGPGEWLPVNAGYRCTYVGRYLRVADKYQLPITTADRTAALEVLPSCPRRKSSTRKSAGGGTTS